MTISALTAEILAIGDELTQGWKVDTNSSEIARELLTAGVVVSRVTAVGDGLGAIAEAMVEATRRVKIVVVTGGLGPTDDDLTREGAAKAMGTGLEFVPELWDLIVARFRARGREIPESNRRQAHRPLGSTTIPNPNGTAPGFAFGLGGARFYALPGVPAEMRAMLTQFVLTDIAGRFAAPVLRRQVLKCFGASEAAVGELIQPYMTRGADPIVGITVSRGVHTISAVSIDDVKITATVDAIARKLGPLVYSRIDENLEEAVGRRLIEARATIALAESCTGGLATALLTSLPGISAVLKESFVTYTNAAKTARLGVSEELLRSHGAVSRECAAAMAEGVRRVAGVSIGVSITGIAGPDGVTLTKPVGLVFIGVSREGLTDVFEGNYAGLERNLLREIVAREGLNRVRLVVLGA